MVCTVISLRSLSEDCKFMLIAVDLSVTQLKGGRAHLISGDLPELYYTLGLEDWQTEYFCVPGVTGTELNKYFEAHGIRPPPQEAGEEQEQESESESGSE